MNPFRGRSIAGPATQLLMTGCLLIAASCSHAAVLSDTQATQITREAGQPTQVHILDTYAEAAQVLAATPGGASPTGPRFDGKGLMESLAEQKRPSAGSLVVPGKPPVCAIVLPPSLDNPVSTGMLRQGIDEGVVRRFITHHELWHCMENSHRGASADAGAGALFTRALPRFGRPTERLAYQEVGADLFALSSMADEGQSVRGVLKALQTHRTTRNAYDGHCLNSLQAPSFRNGPVRTRIARVLDLRAQRPGCWRQGAAGHSR